MEKLISTPMSDVDIRKYIPVEKYSDFTGQLPIIILYEASPNYGHWCMLHITKAEDKTPALEFFDSYGMMPDDALKVLGKKYEPNLIKWLIDTKKPLAYNQFKFQGSGSNVMTCGRHCVMRHIFKDYSIEDYAKAVYEVCSKLNITPDELSCLIVP